MSPSTALCAALLASLLPSAAAQLADLQPGRNFVAEATFGFGWHENIDFGDADNDGDMDAVVANGGEIGPKPNRIFINQGGLQGGSVGTFANETAERFAGIPDDTTRDIEFVDFEGDGDLDVQATNRGEPALGEVSRFHVNLGGLQGGTIGYYTEDTDNRWGALVSVPAAQEVDPDDLHGPFRDWPCDCDFADLDDDGCMDLFHASYGPSQDGSLDSRIFLNDSRGVFNELWPWANAGADTKTHSADLDLVDLDADFDIDVVVSSRNSQARVYLNNLYGGLSGSAFQDITQYSLIAQGVLMNGNSNYEGEYGDVDGDGDFDVWLLNWNGFTDRIARNDGFVAGSGVKFSQQNNWIKNDANADENEVDFTDFDGDGDLDAFLANFSGTNHLYVSGLAQGLDPFTTGLYHRAGASGSIYAQGELPTGNPGALTTLDGETVDADNDGDQDLAAANHSNQQAYLYRNVLGVPDTHAPTVHLLTDPADQANGTGTVIHAQLRDNTSYYVVNFYPTVLVYSVNGGASVTVPMRAQGSLQFRGVIPAQSDATVTFHVETADLAGNAAISAEVTYGQGSPAPGAFTNLGGGLAGSAGIPQLSGSGSLAAGSPGAMALALAAPAAPSLLLVSLADTPTAFKGGTLHTLPIAVALPLATDAAGAWTLPWAAWPAGVPAGQDIFHQVLVLDAAAPAGVALSNLLRASAP
jgi:hypothetical protein